MEQLGQCDADQDRPQQPPQELMDKGKYAAAGHPLGRQLPSNLQVEHGSEVGSGKAGHLSQLAPFARKVHIGSARGYRIVSLKILQA